ncbi:MAG: hypothetical protein PVH07_07595 [Chloroflexota bacterium]|jgi:hypothetical protein
MRLDRALRHDLASALRSWSIRLYLGLQLAAALVFVVRRGSDQVVTVVLIWLAMMVLAFVAWWAGRHRLAHPQPDAVAAAGPRALFALLGVAGMTLWGFGMAAEVGFVLVALGLGGWTFAAVRAGGPVNLRARLVRDPRPFLPLLLLIGLPKLLALGPPYIVGAALALPSGIGQQLLYLVGLFGPLEAATGRAAGAAVGSALAFALVHVPLVLDANHGDLLAAMANAVLFQSSVGLIAVLAYMRHRAVVPIGVAHALAIG